MPVRKKILLIFLIIIALLQFFPRSVNSNKEILSTDITNEYHIPNKLHSLLQKACYDCHSNNTNYPWYAYIQPFRLMLDRHVKEGKKDLNFSEFTSYSEKKQYNKLISIAESLKKGTMPLSSYKMLHSEARLTQAEKDLLIEWINDARNLIRSEKSGNE